MKHKLQDILDFIDKIKIPLELVYMTHNGILSLDRKEYCDIILFMYENNIDDLGDVFIFDEEIITKHNKNKNMLSVLNKLKGET